MAERVRLSQTVEATGKSIVDSAFKVHKALGPGLLESIYETCLVHELTQRGHALQRQVAIPIVYEGLRLEGGLRLDIIVDGHVIIEVKAVERDAPIFLAQLVSYLKLSKKHLGFLINFNVPIIKDGIRRAVVA